MDLSLADPCEKDIYLTDAPYKKGRPRKDVLNLKKKYAAFGIGGTRSDSRLNQLTPQVYVQLCASFYGYYTSDRREVQELIC